MQTIKISDITLRGTYDSPLSFKEKIEIAKQLDFMGVDVIEIAKISNVKTDTLFLHTVAPLIKNSTVSCVADFDKESLDNAWNAIKDAKKPRLHIMLPTSPVQMEYVCHKKPKAMLELAAALISKAKTLCNDVEISALDATRSEPEFLFELLKVAVASGANAVTLCDTAGTMFPDEFMRFVAKIKANVPELENVEIGVECSDSMSMGAASALACAQDGASAVKVSVCGGNVPCIKSIAYAIKMRGESFNFRTNLNQTALNHSADKIAGYIGNIKIAESTSNNAESNSDFTLNHDDDIKTVAEYIKKLGYDLTEEDTNKVYENFKRLSEKKTVSTKELEAIIASSALQVAPTYVMKSYVINSGNIITATAHIELEKDGQLLTGISIGDGPIDASFRAIEQIIGHHFELDDFQIQSLTEGKEAMGDALVKLRADGKLYSGRGISTDIVGASIRAYISALNKICFEEA